VRNSAGTGTAPADYWSVRWSGYLLAPSWLEEFTLYVDVGNSEDSIAVYLDGQALIGGDAWNPATGRHTPYSHESSSRHMDSAALSESSSFTSPPTLEQRINVQRKHALEVDRTWINSEASARSYEEFRYAFPDEIMPLNGSDLFNNDRMDIDQLWATNPFGKTVSKAATTAATATGYTTYTNTFSFPRLNDPHTLEVIQFNLCVLLSSCFVFCFLFFCLIHHLVVFHIC
jgi:hypothetical protein